MRFNSDPDAIYLVDCFLRQYFFRRPIPIDSSFTQYHQARKEERGEVEIVERGDDGQAALALELAHELEDLDSMLEIEEGGRLIEQENLRFLGPATISIASGCQKPDSW